MKSLCRLYLEYAIDIHTRRSVLLTIFHFSLWVSQTVVVVYNTLPVTNRRLLSHVKFVLREFISLFKKRTNNTKHPGDRFSEISLQCFCFNMIIIVKSFKGLSRKKHCHDKRTRKKSQNSVDGAKMWVPMNNPLHKLFYYHTFYFQHHSGCRWNLILFITVVTLAKWHTDHGIAGSWLMLIRDYILYFIYSSLAALSLWFLIYSGATASFSTDILPN